MKTLFLIITILTLTGCVTASYTANDTDGEAFKMTSLFKSVDGLYTEKGKGKFTMKIDKTHTQDPMGSMVDMLKLMQMMQFGMAPDPANQ